MTVFASVDPTKRPESCEMFVAANEDLAAMLADWG